VSSLLHGISPTKGADGCVVTLASDANGPGSTPGGTLELDTGYHLLGVSEM